MPRLRIRVTGWPRRALVLTDTPAPDCPDCAGDGGIEHDYGDYETGEYAGTEWEPCHCWNENRRMVLLPLPRRPRWLRRHGNGRDPWGSDDYSNEPPF
ncbi:hypothetical protein G9272_25205 [Streptomyces asoensis]|uniref:Uncharacterized protein n=1 Tax=Streptomyces asoensis TaxID=249586 RepID=A0A6M4X4B8_9ACTN|nr:hypothetical protein [Streptomyces asoensis]QJT07042.1 hypothetical protein G9272_25205 [Streptomyces asoensis]